MISSQGFKRHEKYCYLNSDNIKLCPVCDKPIKNYRYNTTCGYSCSNTHHRSGESHPNWKEDSYQTTCFLYHKRECIVCGEDKIVEVHHYDENNKNNTPNNLVPLCPTHHQYYHSRYRYCVDDIINKYVNKYVGVG